MVKVDNHWVETALIGLAKKGAADVEFAGLSDEMSFGGGERDIAVRTLLNGGNIRRFTPMTMTEVNFKIYPDDVDDAMQFFFGTANTVATGNLTTTNVLLRFDVRVTILWTDKTTVTTATGAVATAAAIRVSEKDGNITKCTPFWDDGELGFDVTIKIPAYTPAAGGNSTWASQTGSGTLAAIAQYA